MHGARGTKGNDAEGGLGSDEAALLRGFPLAGRGPVRPEPDEERLRQPKPDEERLRRVGVSIEGGEGALPPPKGEAGKALAKGGKRRKRGREGQNNKEKWRKEGGQVK